MNMILIQFYITARSVSIIDNQQGVFDGCQSFRSAAVCAVCSSQYCGRNIYCTDTEHGIQRTDDKIIAMNEVIKQRELTSPNIKYSVIEFDIDGININIEYPALISPTPTDMICYTTLIYQRNSWISTLQTAQFKCSKMA